MQSMDNKRFVLACSLIILLAVGIITGVIITMSRRVADVTQPKPSSLTANGSLACLPHKNTAPGQPQTEECAIGLKTDDGRYYGLQDLPQNASTTSSTKHVTVSGDLTPPGANDRYNTLGTIKVKTFTAN